MFWAIVGTVGAFINISTVETVTRKSCGTFTSETFGSANAILTRDIDISAGSEFVTCVSTIGAFIDLLADGTVTIDIIETSIAGTCERARIVGADGKFITVMNKNISAFIFIDIFSGIITIG